MVYSSDSLEGLKYTEAVQRLKESGFSNVHTKEISDLTISRDDEENVVTEVKLLFGDSFDERYKIIHQIYGLRLCIIPWNYILLR